MNKEIATTQAPFKWSPTAYISIMRVDLDQAREELSRYSNEGTREDQVYQIQETLRFATKVVENAKRALQVLNGGNPE